MQSIDGNHRFLVILNLVQSTQFHILQVEFFYEQCTLVEIDQVSSTHGVVLSKPAWTWGAEMGANDKGLCIGCTSVWTTLCQPGDHSEKLLGVDYVR